MLGVGSYHWPDTSGVIPLWFTCATADEFASDPNAVRYAEVTSNSGFAFSGSGVSKSTAQFPVRSQFVRITETEVTPATPEGAWFDGQLRYFTCPLQSACVTDAALTVIIIPASSTCGCASEIADATLVTHGFYKAQPTA